MDLEMVLNELSLRSPATDVQTARRWMSELISTILTATTHGVKRSLRTHSELNIVELSPGYPVARWRNDNEVDRDTRRFFTVLVTKTPFLVDVSNPEIQSNVNLSDCFCGEERAVGLGIAYWLEALALSLRSEPQWDASHLKLKITQLNEDGEIADTLEEIPHASCSDHVWEHRDWISERTQKAGQAEVRSGADIWERKDVLFPSLQFCEAVGGQLENLLHGDLMLWPIMKRLYELEHYCTEWLDGPFDSQKITSKATPESPITLEMFGQERTFLCPDGEVRMFSWHVRLTPGKWRIYFYPLQTEKKLVIGYIGLHLPTAKYP